MTEFFDALETEVGTLRRGTKFVARGGPFYRSTDGTTTRMHEDGPFTFVRYCEAGERQWIEAWAREGFCIVNLGETHESSVVHGLVMRPYRIVKVVSQPEGDFDMSTTKTKKTTTTKVSKAKPTTKATTEAKTPRKAKAKPEAAEGKLSALDAAHQILAKSSEPLTTKEMIEKMAAAGPWR